MGICSCHMVCKLIGPAPKQRAVLVKIRQVDEAMNDPASDQ